MRLTNVLSYYLNRQSSTQWTRLAVFRLIPLYFLFCCNIGYATVAQQTNGLVASFSIDKSLVIKNLSDNFEQLPERKIASNNIGNVFAQYAQPTTRYSHGILGDSIEAEQLVVFKDGTTYTHTLGNMYVFEDIKPRLFDVDNDGEMEIITIRTHVTKGAGIMIYKIIKNELTEFSWVEEIGTSSRWLNIVSIYDLDSDGEVELVWIQTPHIGGILKVARIKAGKLDVLSELANVSNHSIGERNLCLSVVTKKDNKTIFYVPTQDRRQIVGFKFTDGVIQQIEIINQPVNFSYPLLSQYNFSNVVLGSNFCAEL